MTIRGPRIGRADRLAELDAQLATTTAPGGPRGMPAVTRLLLSPGPTPFPPGASREALAVAAAQLAEQLAPLPKALDEIATKIIRHCAVAGRDAELSRAVLLVRDRSYALWFAISGFRQAAGRGAR